MAPVGGRPFIAYLTDYFRAAGIEKFIFALGYRSDQFNDFLQSELPEDSYQISIEDEPLGTGGAIQRACGLALDPTVLVLNGDTFFGIDVPMLSDFHAGRNADCTLCLRPMQDFNRFGVVELGADQQVLDFREKKQYAAGLINGGVYALNKEQFLKEGLPEKFSFEKEYLEAFYTRRQFFGLVQDSYFIDIGIPEDYERVQREIERLKTIKRQL
jgi:D-glycero-alpha-D-manno-heptose 1-phosphate guanylyltransferase